MVGPRYSGDTIHDTHDTNTEDVVERQCLAMLPRYSIVAILYGTVDAVVSRRCVHDGSWIQSLHNDRFHDSTIQYRRSIAKPRYQPGRFHDTSWTHRWPTIVSTIPPRMATIEYRGSIVKRCRSTTPLVVASWLSWMV